MTTIYQVAERAGVSPATVSRVLNGREVRADNRDRVLEAAEALGYRPNSAARTLRTQSANVIGLIIPDIENPFFTSLARGVEDRVQQAGLSLLLCNTDEDTTKEARYVDVAIAEQLAGIVVAPAGDGASLKQFLQRQVPVVLVDRDVSGVETDAVVLDNAEISRRLTRSLYDAGYERVACIVGPQAIGVARDRAAGWRQEFARHHRGSPERYLRYSDSRVDGGRQACLEVLRVAPAPDALFVGNNLMTVGALRALDELGRRPPAVGVASFGDLPFGLRGDLPISVLDVPARELGEQAAAYLLDRIDGYAGPPRRAVLDAYR